MALAEVKAEVKPSRDPVLGTDGESYRPMTDLQMTEVETVVHASVDELVFAKHFVEDDCLAEAQEALLTIAMNVERLQEMVEGQRVKRN